MSALSIEQAIAPHVQPHAVSLLLIAITNEVRIVVTEEERDTSLGREFPSFSR